MGNSCLRMFITTTNSFSAPFENIDTRERENKENKENSILQLDANTIPKDKNTTENKLENKTEFPPLDIVLISRDEANSPDLVSPNLASPKITSPTEQEFIVV